MISAWFSTINFWPKWLLHRIEEEKKNTRKTKEYFLAFMFYETENIVKVYNKMCGIQKVSFSTKLTLGRNLCDCFSNKRSCMELTVKGRQLNMENNFLSEIAYLLKRNSRHSTTQQNQVVFLSQSWQCHKVGVFVRFPHTHTHRDLYTFLIR